MNNDKLINKIIKDDNLNVWHISLLFAVTATQSQSNGSKEIQVTRKKLMAYSHIGSIVTYHKCIKELVTFGYIEYHPSYHPKEGSMIILLT